MAKKLPNIRPGEVLLEEFLVAGRLRPRKTGRQRQARRRRELGGCR